MTCSLRMCRACGEPITDPDDGVYMGYEHTNSGPGRELWAHRDHVAEAARLDPDHVRILARILLLRAFGGL
ncbi:hypothetical protein [Streptomyces griseosporeus]|uniref:hypothetical protein n=1 Tax=Streptomyces griseosporeus TaxID=1910 RepID=UPI0036C6D43E